MISDKLEITEIINRYFAALDERAFDLGTFRKFLAYEVTVTRPNGMALTGPEAIRASHEKSMERFRATQHLTSGFIIDLNDKGQAVFRVNLIALHFWNEGYGEPGLKKDDNHFTAGGVVSGKAIQTKNGWQILEIRNDVVWRKGVGFQEMMNTK